MVILTDVSYRRLGLSARPLAIHSSGGVEKVSNQTPVVTGAKRIKTRRSEGIIERNPDGATSVVYPDSDDEQEIPVEQAAQAETDVVKGQCRCFHD
jgi:hypothetical protein